MFLLILMIIFALYVVFSLSIIKSQLNLIMDHLKIKERLDITNEEIEKEMERELMEDLNKPD